MKFIQKWWLRLIISLLLGAFIVEMLRLRTDLITGSTSTLLMIVFALIFYFCMHFSISIYKKLNPRKLNLRKKKEK